MKNFAALVLVALLSGCSFMIKTPVVADYSNLDKISSITTKNDVAILLGTPQSRGTHIIKDKANDLDFYFGFAGTFTMSSAKYNFGTAFVSYKNEKPDNLIYFTAKPDKEIQLSQNLSIKLVADKIILGKSKIDSVFQVLGPAQYTGRRVGFENGIDHSIAYWDASELQPEGSIKEKWLLIGYGNDRTVQDLIWVSSRPEDVREIGEISEQQLRELSRTTFVGLIPVMEPTAMTTGTKIDTVQVDALIKNSPKNIKEFISVLGSPNALGIKSFSGDEPMGLSNWSFSKVEMKGEERNYIPPNASKEDIDRLQSSGSFMVMSVEQSRLMVGHDADGKIKEIMWLRPGRI